MTSGAARRLPTRALAAVLALVWGVLSFGVIDLLTVIDQTPGFYDGFMVESGWGLLFVVMVAVPLVALVVRPEQPVLPAQVALVAVGVAAGALIGQQSRHLLVSVGLLATALVVGWRGPLPSLRARRSTPLIVLAVVALVPCLWYALDIADDPSAQEDSLGFTHGPVQAALAIAVLLVAVLVATTDAPGATLCAATVSVAVAWIGVESVVYPDLVGSLGVIGGVVAALWAVLLLAASLAVRRAATGY